LFSIGMSINFYSLGNSVFEVKSILGEKDLNKNTAIIKNSLNKPIKKLIDIPIENKVIEPESLKDVLKLNVNSINFGS